MAEPFIHRRVVEFVETDMAGIVHFSNFLRWIEAAEAALFRELGLEIIQSDGTTDHGWPRVRASAEYHDAIRFQDVVEIELRVKAIKIKAVEYEAKAYVVDGDTRRHAATGKMTTVYVSKPTAGGPMSSQKLDEPTLAKLAPLAEVVL
ncbi:MAG: acyl-CoA thioesterase [Verrucomicrobiota bacterium]